MSVFLGQLANFLGILSLAKPGLFLLLTSLSSALSRVGTLAFTSSRARIYENFSAAGNLGDLMRCSQAQSTLATLIGTAMGIGVSPLVGADVSSIMAVFFPVSAATHYLAYRAVGTIQLRTINVQRMEAIMNAYLAAKRVPSCAEVATEERFVYWKPRYKVRINPPITANVLNEKIIADLVSQKYCIVRTATDPVDLFIKDNASAQDCIRGMFVAMGGENCDWEDFNAKLVRSNWDLSVAFIDNVHYRVFVDS